MPFPTPPYFPYLYPRKKGRKMDYRNLAEEELKLRIAEQFFPTYDCAHRIGKIDFAVTLRNPQPATRNPRAMQRCCNPCFGQKPSAAQ